MVRADTVRAKLGHLRDTLARLRRLLATPREQFLVDEDLQWAVERGAQVAAECVFDIGNHLLASAFNGHADEYRQIVPRLADRGALPQELTLRLQGLAGLRNLLVHDYAAVDPGRLHDDLVRGLDALEDFAAAVAIWLDARGES